MPSVSVIIPTYNRFSHLQRAVKSVLQQTYTDYEMIIIYDGSTDETFRYFNKKKLPIRYVYQPRMGVSAARNRGIRLARGTFIAFLDSDDLWKPEKLEKHVAFFEENPETLICQTDEMWIRNDKHVNPGYRHKKPSGNIFKKSLDLCLVSPSAVMMRRKFFDIVGIFDETLPVCEDYDLWLRTAYRHEVPLITDELTVKYGGHDDQLSLAYWGMDRFRVYALQKLLQHPLDVLQRKMVIREIRTKCRILLNGAVKRGRVLFVTKILLTLLRPTMYWGILNQNNSKI